MYVVEKERERKKERECVCICVEEKKRHIARFGIATWEEGERERESGRERYNYARKGVVRTRDE